MHKEIASRQVAVLATAILITSLCAIIYQLLVSALSSYLLGSSVLHFSLTIGLFMSFMGLGSYLSKYIQQDRVEYFVYIETAIGFLGGIAAFVLFLSFSTTDYYYLVALILIASISTLVGLELPLVTRLLRQYSSLKDTLAHLLAVDYIGALVASILFPLVFLPYLGIMKTGFLIGIVNIGIAIVTAFEFRGHIERLKGKIIIPFLSIAILTLGFIYSFKLVNYFERFIYQDQIILSEQSAYQRIVLTKFQDDIRLFLNGSIQFSSLDEYRYHEPLVHIPLTLVPSPEHVLILGGGDGLAVREALKHEQISTITLVDIDPRITELAQSHPVLRTLNDNALSSDKVTIVHQDAQKYLETTSKLFSVIIIDLPDPNDTSLGKLYTNSFYKLIAHRLTQDGIVITQASSPYFAP